MPIGTLGVGSHVLARVIDNRQIGKWVGKSEEWCWSGPGSKSAGTPSRAPQPLTWRCLPPSRPSTPGRTRAPGSSC
jgi:hypothetical protein